MLLRLSLFLLASLAYSQITATSDDTQQENQIYGGLLVPPARTDASFHNVTDVTCGGTQRDKVHYITAQNMDSEFRWYIQTPVPESTCLLRISNLPDQTNETGFVNLVPLGRNDVSADGSFPCGRTAGLDYAYFDIPDSIDCDACVLEWIWKGADFQVRQCADISVASGTDTGCYGKCLNGGVCSNGVCVCPPGFSGTYCENEGSGVGRAAKKVLATVFFIILILLLIILLFFLCFWCAQRMIKKGEESQVYNTNKTHVQFYDEQKPDQPRGVDQPAPRIKPDDI